MHSGKTITGSTAICTILATEFPDAGLWPKELADVLGFTLLGPMEKLTSTDSASIKEALQQVNENLAFNMHPVKYTFTIADICLWGAIKGNPLVATEMTSGKYSEIDRWHKEFMEPTSITTKVYKFIRDLSAVHFPRRVNS
jgi:glutamyl-tRNA synthetase